MSSNTCFSNRIKTLFFSVCTGIFLLPVSAGAIQQTVQNANLSVTPNHQPEMRYTTDSSADPRADSTQISTITIVAKNGTGTTCTVRLQIENTVAGLSTSSNTQSLSATYQYLNFTFSPSASFRNNNIKALRISTSGSSCTLATDFIITHIGTNTSADYPYTYIRDQTSGATTTGAYYFAINGGFSTISFVGTPTSTCNFSNFKVLPYYSDADLARCGPTSTCSEGVALNPSTNTSTYLYNTNYGSIPSYSFNSWIPNPFTMTSGTLYNARAYICTSNNQFDCRMGVNSNANIIAYSDSWQFIINGLNTCTSTYYSQSEIPPPGGVTSTVTVDLRSQATTQCDSFNDGSILGGVVWGLCKVLVFMFVPSDDVLNNFKALQTQVATKPPFGYVTVYTGQLSQFSNASSTTSTVATSTFFSTTNMTTFTGAGFYQSVLTVLGYLVYLAFFFYVYWRLKNFSLMG